MQELFAGFDIQKNFSLFYSSLKSKREQAVRPKGQGVCNRSCDRYFSLAFTQANLTLYFITAHKLIFNNRQWCIFVSFPLFNYQVCAYLKFEQKFAVLRLLDTTLLLQEPFLVLITLQFFNVFDGGLEDGAFVLADVSYDIIIPRGDQIKVTQSSFGSQINVQPNAMEPQTYHSFSLISCYLSMLKVNEISREKLQI